MLPDRSGLVVALVLLTASALGGCVGDQGPSDATPAEGNATPEGTAGDAADPGEVDLASVEAPTWDMLDWFAFEASGPWTTNTDYDVIVHSIEGEGYVTATDTREQAVYDLFWDDPFIGRMDEQLNPASPEMPATVFDWPLTPDKTWTSQDGNGTTWEMVAHKRDSVETHAGSFGGYHIRGEAEDGWTIFVTYVPGLEWFSNWMLHRPDGEMMINVDMVGMGSNYSGEMFLGDSNVHVDADWSVTQDAPGVQTFTVAEDATDLRVYVSLGSDPYGFALIGPGGEDVAQASFAGQPTQTIHVEDPAAGDWTLLAQTTGAEEGFLRVVEMSLETMSH